MDARRRLFSDEKMLLCADFTRPVVKAIFRASYDLGSPPAGLGRAAVRDRFLAFWERVRDAKNDAVRQPDLEWTKLICVDAEPLRARSKRR
jgi:hypothetical protein